MTRGPGTRPRILVTGFGSFPGVPENPTSALIEKLREQAGGVRHDVHLAVLDVDYRKLPASLAEIGREVRPDIAIHFGVSARASGFALERLARNRACTTKPDQTGFVPSGPVIRAEAADRASGLPVQRLVNTLRDAALPAATSDDAGDYLCNFLFFLSVGGHCPGFAPAMAGFVHVPAFGTAMGNGRVFGMAELSRGALVIIDACAESWREGSIPTKKAAPGDAA